MSDTITNAQKLNFLSKEIRILRDNYGEGIHKEIRDPEVLKEREIIHSLIEDLGNIISIKTRNNFLEYELDRLTKDWNHIKKLHATLEFMRKDRQKLSLNIDRKDIIIEELNKIITIQREENVHLATYINDYAITKLED